MAEQSLKQKTAGAVIWSLADRLGQQTLVFVVGIIIANILSVKDYALMGMLAIFTAIANIVLESGFTAALIRKQHPTPTDYSSVFYFNVVMSLVLYFFLFFSAPYIAVFFDQPLLTPVSRIVFLALPFNSLSLIQTTLLNKQIKFKKLAQINIISLLIGCVTALAMAVNGYGIWTLAWQPVIPAAVRSLLLWGQKRWVPTPVFSFVAIKELFGYASKLLAANLLNACFQNIYSIFIGKLYPAKEMGYYTQGNKMGDMGVNMLYGSIQNATFSIFSSIQDQPERLVRAYRKTIRFTAFLTFPLLLGLLSVAKPFIQILLKEEWWPCIPFLQLLCVGGCFTILSTINTNFIKIGGHSNKILKLECIKIIITAITLALTYKYSVLVMVTGLVVTRIVVYIIHTIYTGWLTGYKWYTQLWDIFPYIAISLIMCYGIYMQNDSISNRFILLIVQVITGIAIYIGLTYLTGSRILKDAIELLYKKKI